MRFTKMEGIGNDYVYINGFEENVQDPASLSIAMSKPHFGCGADGLILILPSEVADFRMRMFNNDGSESEMCGNGMRCVGRYCYDRGLTNQTTFTVESGGKVKGISLTLEEGEVTAVTVDMGCPELSGLKIPSSVDQTPVMGHLLMVDNRAYHATLVNMGNPHAVIFGDDPANAPVLTDGPRLECHPDFPKKANIEFVQVIDRHTLKMRVWERGTGETMACGTGACATLVASVLQGFTDRSATVKLPGGDLVISWDATDDHVYLTGPATFVYDGVWLQ